MKQSTWSRSLAVHGVEVLQPRMVEDSLAGRLVGIGGPLVNGGRLIKAVTGEVGYDDSARLSRGVAVSSSHLSSSSFLWSFTHFISGNPDLKI